MRNPPLILGLSIVGLLVLVALFGPALAPRDPLERTLVAEIGGRMRGVPFPPFQSWDFPLGSDRFGRDLFSRLLWAVRPTLLLVLIVASLRLALGLLIGALAGWSQRPLGRGLNSLIDTALTIPVLLVALAAITALGPELGLPAFVIGMALTGWAETAQSVRTATTQIAVQPYIVAARALGANGPQILVRHITRHLTPLLAILFAFEVSATLMLTAGLGFLGYFIGGGVWIIADGDLLPQAARVAGLPELGQLVGTADRGIRLQLPYEMLFPGLVLAFAILGFTLLGEGLHRRQSQLQPRYGRIQLALTGIEEQVVIGAGRWNGWIPLPVTALFLALGLGLTALFLWPTAQPTATLPPSSLVRPAGWSAERGDPFGTLDATVPTTEPALAWDFQATGGLVGGPAIAPDGTLYLNGADATLYALNPDGPLRWQISLSQPAVGSPALGADGTIYVVDQRAGLSAISPAGVASWRFQSSYRTDGTGGPVVGADGSIYYTVIDAVQAVTPDGQARWLGRDPGLPYVEAPPRLSPDGELVFLKSSVFSAQDGARLVLTLVPDESFTVEPQQLVGADGRTFYRSEHRLIPWRLVEGGLTLQPAIAWGSSNLFAMPADTGVSRDGIIWVTYASPFFDTRLIWLGPEGGVRGEAFFPQRNSRVVAADPTGDLLVCGSQRNRTLHCGRYTPDGAETPLWAIIPGRAGATLSGAALVDGWFYLATTQGEVWAFRGP
ncbi:MAG: PQQ-binding-like beta-propeller repeat protein [Oscillochloridaceae bacterium umkhey_bin13]